MRIVPLIHACARPCRSAGLAALLLLPGSGISCPHPSVAAALSAASLDPGVRSASGPSLGAGPRAGRRGRTGSGVGLVRPAGSAPAIQFDEGAASVRVRVRDEEGRPVHGAVVSAWLADEPIGWELSDEEGAVELVGTREALPNLTVRVRPPPEDEYLVSARAGIPATGGDLTVRLVRGVRLEGHLVEASTGIDLAFASLRVLMDDQDATWMPALTDARGRFGIGGVMPGASMEFVLDSPAAQVAPSSVRWDADLQGSVEHIELRAEVPGLCRIRIDAWSAVLRPVARLVPVLAGVQGPALEAAVSREGVALFWGIPDADSFFVAVDVLSGSNRDLLQTYVPEPPLGEIRVRLEQPQHFSGSVRLPAGLELELVALRAAGGTRRVAVDGDGNFSDRTSGSGPFYLEGVAVNAEGKRVKKVIRGTLDSRNFLDFR